MKTLLISLSLITALFFSATNSLEAQKRKVNKLKPTKVSTEPIPGLTAEGYRDLIVNNADAVYLLQNGVIKGVQALQSTPVCVVTLDTEKQKLAADSAANHRKAWTSARVPAELAASHKEILSWIESAETQLKSAPECMYGGSMPLLIFLGTFGAYEDKRTNAATALTRMGVTLPPIQKLATASAEPAKAPAKLVPELTTEGYRDLIVNTADAMSEMGAYAEITPGTRVEYVNGRARDCILTFTVTEPTAKFVADRIKAWESTRVPKALAASHGEILKWMKAAEQNSKLVPRCFEPLLQATAQQFGFLLSLGDYDDLRKNAATALQTMGVTLPPIVKSTPKKKAVPVSVDTVSNGGNEQPKPTTTISGLLGSKSNPVRCDGPGGEKQYLNRLQCADSKPPTYSRIGSFLGGPYGNILDGYKVKCEGIDAVTIFMDMYHKGYVEKETIPEFIIVSQTANLTNNPVIGLWEMKGDVRSRRFENRNGEIFAFYLSDTGQGVLNSRGKMIFPIVWGGKFDGFDKPVYAQNLDSALVGKLIPTNQTRACSAVDSNTTEIVVKESGKIVRKVTMQVSLDGETLTETVREVDKKGQVTSTSELVFVKSKK